MSDVAKEIHVFDHSGDKKRADEWLIIFNQLSIQYRRTELMKFTVVETKFEGSAALWYRSKAQVCEQHFRKVFVPATNHATKYEEMRNRVQGKDGPSLDFLRDKMQLMPAEQRRSEGNDSAGCC